MDKVHTTNYFDTLITLADDCQLGQAQVPVMKTINPTLAWAQYNLLIHNPYRFTSDEVLFAVFAERAGIPVSDRGAARQKFFSVGQPCFRASPLPKKYGFGVHADHQGKIALLPVESEAYARLLSNPAVKKLKAMRSKR